MISIEVVRKILWQDQAEWYIVCQDCYDKHKHHLWSGSTKVKDWPKHKKEVEEYAKTVEKCEFCKVEFGIFERPQFSQEIFDIERLPEINNFWEVDPGLSNEWDLFWLMGEKRKVEYFEVAPDFRKNKIRFLIESQNVSKVKEE